MLVGALMRMAGVFLAEMQQLTPKEWQRRSGSEGVAVKAGGLAKPERKIFAIDAGGVAVKEWQGRRAGLQSWSVKILLFALGKYLGICWIF